MQRIAATTLTRSPATGKTRTVRGIWSLNSEGLFVYCLAIPRRIVLVRSADWWGDEGVEIECAANWSWRTSGNWQSGSAES